MTGLSVALSETQKEGFVALRPKLVKCVCVLIPLPHCVIGWSVNCDCGESTVKPL